MTDKHEQPSKLQLKDLLIAVAKFVAVTALAFLAIVGIGAVFIDSGVNTQL